MTINTEMLLTLYRWLQSQQPAMTETLGTLVQFETPSGDKARIDAAQAWLARQCADLGEVQTIEQSSGNLLSLRVPAETDRAHALILGHMDTVWSVGTLANMPWRITEEHGEPVAWGPGAYDMKAGLTIVLYALRALQAQGLHPVRPLVFLVTADEEVGSRHSRARIEQEARQAAAVYVVEPPVAGGALKTARKGVGRFDLTVTGKAAHAGVEPEKGVSAIQELAHQILALHALNVPERGTTVNVGVVSGGTRANVVAAGAHAEIDLRVTTLAESERLVQAMTSLRPVHPDAQVQVTGGLNRPPFERSAGVAALFAQAAALANHLGFGPLREASTGGGSDGNFTAALGIPTLDGLAADGAGAHAANERVRLNTLPQKAALLAGLLLSKPISE